MKKRHCSGDADGSAGTAPANRRYASFEVQTCRLGAQHNALAASSAALVDLGTSRAGTAATPNPKVQLVNALLTDPQSGSGLVFAAVGTTVYPVPAGVTWIQVEVWGSGGGGVGVKVGPGGGPSAGGGGGAVVSALLPAKSSCTVTVGGGGAGSKDANGSGGGAVQGAMRQQPRLRSDRGRRLRRRLCRRRRRRRQRHACARCCGAHRLHRNGRVERKRGRLGYLRHRRQQRDRFGVADLAPPALVPNTAMQKSAALAAGAAGGPSEAAVPLAATALL